MKKIIIILVLLASLQLFAQEIAAPKNLEPEKLVFENKAPDIDVATCYFINDLGIF